jgi:hypothetical protein
MKYNATATACTFSLIGSCLTAGGAWGATYSVLPLDGSGDYQAPAGILAFDQLRTGFGPNEGTFERDVRSNRDNAQTFTLPSATTIDKIAINFQEAPVAAATATFEFFSVADPEASTLTPVTMIDSVSFSNTDLGTASGTLVFDVANTVAAANSSFAVRLNTDSSTTAVFKWTFVATTYANGHRYENNSRPSQDEDYTVGVVAVPEPATAMLLSASMLGLAMRRRRR